MSRIVFVFPNNDAAQNFLAWFSDGGGESSFFQGEEFAADEAGRLAIRRFDYSKAFPAWGYDPAKHGPDRTVEAQL